MGISRNDKLVRKISRIFCISVIIIFLGVMIHYLSRIFIRDSFIVNTSSMEPTIMPGSRIFVNKFIFGPRIYTNFKFEEGGDLHSLRIPGLRKIKRNDIIVFNYPFDEAWTRIQFKINYVYTKRVIGLPGDTLSIKDGYYCISDLHEDLGNVKYQEILSNSYSNILQLEPSLFPNNPDYNWTIIDFGPYYIPRKGDIIELNEENKTLYKLLIENESGSEALNSQTYTFKQNYYFVAGDNIFSSKDSRYFGAIPEDYIIGVVSKIKK